MGLNDAEGFLLRCVGSRSAPCTTNKNAGEKDTSFRRMTDYGMRAEEGGAPSTYLPHDVAAASWRNDNEDTLRPMPSNAASSDTQPPPYLTAQIERDF
jgi:hypothetical protein